MREAVLIVGLACLGGMVLIGSAVFVTGCDKTPEDPCAWHRVGSDPAVYERVFADCLKALPKGPERLTASGNDWDEVVEQCRKSASDIGNHVAVAACRKALGAKP